MKTTQNTATSYLLDLLVYIAIMFLIRETYIPNTHFMVSGFLYSITTLIVATLLMKRRGVTWKSIGLCRPKSIPKSVLIAGGVFISIIIMLVAFHFFQDAFELFKETPQEKMSSSTGKTLSNGDYGYFFSVILFVWLQSALEELLERAFLIHWLEGLFQSIPLKTALAIIIQACIWGFRHSYDVSERSISVALIGIIMGVAYVAFGRNLWAVIIAHCAMNTLSLI